MIPAVTSEHTKSVHASLPWSLLEMISRSVQAWPCEKRAQRVRSMARQSKAGSNWTLVGRVSMQLMKRTLKKVYIHRKTSSQESYDLHRFSMIIYGRSIFSLHTLEE